MAWRQLACQVHQQRVLQVDDEYAAVGPAWTCVRPPVEVEAHETEARSECNVVQIHFESVRSA